jgi:hypothetical protein
MSLWQWQPKLIGIKGFHHFSLFTRQSSLVHLL